MAKDVFISYSSLDNVIAEKICMVLEELGLDCWIAPRDILAGTEFDVAILNGIDECQALVVVLSPDANTSVFVRNEVNRAFSQGKPILTFRVEDVKPGRALEFYLARHQWTDGFPPPIEGRITRMARALLELLGRGARQSSNASDRVPRDDRETKTGASNSSLSDSVEDKIESAEAYESIGDVWSAAKIYGQLSAELETSGNESLASEMKNRAKLNRRAAAKFMRGE